MRTQSMLLLAVLRKGWTSETNSAVMAMIARKYE